MEYLNSIHDSLRTIDESNIEYIDLLTHPEFFFGNINFSNDVVDFCKYPKHVQEDMVKYGRFATESMERFNNASCGVRLRISTSSNRLIFKVRLRRKWGFLKMVNWNSMGFDVYGLNNNEYIHRTVFAPQDGYNIFAHEIYSPKNGEICIFLPSYNTIEKLYVGIEKESSLKPLEYPLENRLPIVFYGNSVTQGAAASRSGNAFPNIVSRKLNQDIINISCTSCCRGDLEMADLIGKINCHAIVIDYTRNAYNLRVLRLTHERFYKRLREYHPNIKIIFMTSEIFDYYKDPHAFDKVVIETYENALKRNENVSLINQCKLFDKSEHNYIAIDAAHYCDYGMFKVANEICKLVD